jgi:ABC-type uncharacterized transport system permease subunit
MSLSDRLLVIHRGHIVDEFTHDSMSEIAVGLAMGGQAVDEEAIAAANALHAEKAELVSTDLDGDGIPDELQKPAPVVPVAEAPTHEEAFPTRSTGSTVIKTIFTNAAQPILAVVAALVIGAIIIALLGKNPATAYSELFISSLTTPYGIGALLAHTVQLMILSAAVIVSFRAGFFNVGGEGQLYVGALAGALTGIALKSSSLPPIVVILLVLLVAFVVGGIWGWIPGALLAFWNVNIIVTTLMMSSIATLLTQYLVTGPFVDKSYGSVGSKKLGSNAMLPVLERGVQPHAGHHPGDRHRRDPGPRPHPVRVGAEGARARRDEPLRGVHRRQPPDDEHAGHDALGRGRRTVRCAVRDRPQLDGRFLQTFSPSYGFTALTVALLARLNPWVAILAAVFYADMIAGSSSMQANADVPKPLVDVILGLIVLMITATFAWNWSRRKKVVKSAFVATNPSRRREREVNDVLHTVFSVALIAATLTYLTPILFASIGGAITQQGDILNIGLEGMMLIGAFAAIAVGAASSTTPLVGVLAAVASSLLLSAIYAVFALWLKADFIVVGIGVNMLAAGASVFALQLLYGNPGGTPQSVRSSLPKFTLPILGQQTLLVYLALLCVPLYAFLLYRTRYGVHLRAVGRGPARRRRRRHQRAAGEADLDPAVRGADGPRRCSALHGQPGVVQPGHVERARLHRGGRT